MSIQAEVWTIAKTDQGHALLIRPLNSNVAVPIFVGTLEAHAILIGMGNVPMPRPLTHDLLINILKMHKIKVSKVEITSLTEDTFYSRITLDQDGKERIIDSRPSDAIALVVRLNCPLYIEEGIIQKAGIETSLLEEAANDAINPVSQREVLEKQLEEAVQIENYEEAARIRDHLKRLL